MPRTLDEQREWLSSRTGARIVLVAVDDPTSGATVTGFSSLSPYRERPAYATTVEDSVYVHARPPGPRRRAPAARGARSTPPAHHGFHTMVARIVSDHDASIGLHRACGFEVVGTEREVGRKFSRWLDVVTMQLML